MAKMRSRVLAVLTAFFVATILAEAAGLRDAKNEMIDAIDRNSFVVQIRASPKMEDAYCDTQVSPPDWALGRTVIGFEPLPGWAAHHMILFHCPDTPMNRPDERTDQCNSDEGNFGTCGSIQFVWAHGGNPLWLPPHVGLKIGAKKGEASFALQVHFGIKADTWSDRSGVRLILAEEEREWDQPKVMLLVPRTFPPLDPNRELVLVGEKEIRRVSEPMGIFAVRAHAHKRGVWNEVTASRDGRIIWTYRRDTQLPQSFIPLPEHVFLLPGDEVRFKCAYDTTMESRTVYQGSTKNDEMCNVYLMYYTSNKSSQGGKHLRSKLRSVEECQVETLSSAPKESQIVGISADSTRNHIYVFHRGSAIWDVNSFTRSEEYKGRAIDEDVLLVIDATSNKLLSKMGAGEFFMPHSVKADPDRPGIVWLADVGRHQIIEYNVDEKGPLRRVGTAMKPGGGKDSFCKPTDIAFSRDRTRMFVTDGYCNGRIVVLRRHDLSYITEYGSEGSGLNEYDVPHSINIVDCGPSKELLVVSDRENARVKLLDAKDGSLIKLLQPWEGDAYPYSSVVDPVSKRFFAGLVYRDGASKGAIWMSEYSICSIKNQSSSFSGSQICDASHDQFEEPHMMTVLGRRLLVAESGGGKKHGRLAEVAF